MKAKMLILFAYGFVSALAVNAIAQQIASGPDLANFKIELSIDRTENGVQMECTEGCAWETLSFSCDPSGPDCEGSFDEFGTPAQ